MTPSEKMRQLGSNAYLTRTGFTVSAYEAMGLLAILEREVVGKSALTDLFDRNRDHRYQTPASAHQNGVEDIVQVKGKFSGTAVQYQDLWLVGRASGERFKLTLGLGGNFKSSYPREPADTGHDWINFLFRTLRFENFQYHPGENRSFPASIELVEGKYSLTTSLRHRKLSHIVSEWMGELKN